MIKNESLLNKLELKMTKIIIDYLDKVGMKHIEPEVDWDSPHYIEFHNDFFRFRFVIKPEDHTRGVEMHIPIVFLSHPYSGKGIFKALMDEIMNECKNHHGMSVFFVDVISEYFFDSLIKNGGQAIQDEVNVRHVKFTPSNWF